ncbi:MAG: radical SAM protein [Bacillota bacterium]
MSEKLNYNLTNLLLADHMIDIPYNHKKHIFFNRTNGAICLLSKRDISRTSNKSSSKNENLYIKLTENKILEYEGISIQKKFDSFLVTIEMSTLCNLQCLYCYQDKEVVRKEITNEILEKIYAYITAVLEENNKINYVVIGYIGGEPLLHKEKLIKSIKKINELCQSFNKSCYFHIDTNGTIDFSSCYNTMNHLELSVSLSSKNDHNINRPSLYFNSFEVIFENLSRLNNTNNKLSIRYNTNQSNLKDFSKFVRLVRNRLPHVYNIDPMYTDNYEINKDFNNCMSIKEFAIWNSTKSIDILIKNRFPITGVIASSLKLCAAYQPFSCKIHSDGYVTLCDSMPYSTILHVTELSKNISLLNERYFEYKNYNPLDDSKCKACKKIVQCQGRLFCKTDSCLYEKRYDELHFLKSFVKYSLKGKAKFFVNMTDD